MLYSFITKFLKLFSTRFFLSFTTILKLFDFDTDILLFSLLYILFILLLILLLLLLLLLLNEEKKVVLIFIDEVPPISLDISDDSLSFFLMLEFNTFFNRILFSDLFWTI